MALRQATCTSCQHSFRVSSSAAAGKVACPKCGGEAALAEASPETRATAGRAGSAVRPTSGTAGGRRRTAPSAARASGADKKNLPLVLGGVGAVVALLALGYFVLGDGEEAPVASAAEVAPAYIDLSKIPDLKPLEGTSAESWAAMNELMARYTTPPFGPTSTPFGDRLMIQGKRSMPAILNGFKRLDLTTPHGAQVGWKIQTLLLQGLSGHDANFGWHRETRPEDVAFNQKVIELWFQAWELAGEDDEIWKEIAKHKGIPPGLAKPAPAAGADAGEKSDM